MSTTIYKYPIPYEGKALHLPVGFRPIHVGLDPANPSPPTPITLAL